MRNAMTLAVIVVALFWLCGGLAGVLWCYALSVPIGLVIALIGLALGWFKN